MNTGADCVPSWDTSVLLGWGRAPCSSFQEPRLLGVCLLGVPEAEPEELEFNVIITRESVSEP